MNIHVSSQDYYRGLGGSVVKAWPRVPGDGACRFESSPRPLGVERMGSFLHPSPCVGLAL